MLAACSQCAQLAAALLQVIHQSVRQYRPSVRSVVCMRAAAAADTRSLLQLYENASPCAATKRRTRRVTAGEPCAAPPILIEAVCC
jgi:hypothetical protein